MLNGYHSLLLLMTALVVPTDLDNNPEQEQKRDCSTRDHGSVFDAYHRVIRLNELFQLRLVRIFSFYVCQRVVDSGFSDFRFYIFKNDGSPSAATGMRRRITLEPTTALNVIVTACSFLTILNMVTNRWAI